jgi:hypothetical protein
VNSLGAFNDLRRIFLLKPNGEFSSPARKSCLDISGIRIANSIGLRSLIMSRSTTTMAMAAFSGLLLTGGSSAAEPATNKPTAMEKMMPSDQVAKMRACEKRAMDEKIKMDERTRFIEDCMSK